MAKLKQRKCKACHHPFTPARSTQTACGIDCAMQLAHEKKVKLAECDRLDTARKDRARKERLKSISQLAKEAEREINRYVRARDAKDGCISCDKPASWYGQWHASHFRSVGLRRNYASICGTSIKLAQFAITILVETFVNMSLV